MTQQQHKEPYLFGRNIELWFGIVEHRLLDNLKIGRLKVRVFEHHTPDKALMPTENLPDCLIAESFGGGFWHGNVREGDTVFGVWLDKHHQSMLALGKIDASEMNRVIHPEGHGYKDARTQEELEQSPRQVITSYVYSPKSGVQITTSNTASPYPAYVSQPSIPFLSHVGEFYPVNCKPADLKTFAITTKFNTADGTTWNERPTEWAAVYPFNHVYQSESLHWMEFDDTPGAERVTLKHRTGSGFEYFPDGSRVNKVVKDNYEVVLGDNYVGITGVCHVHVKGDATLLIDGDRTEHVKGNYRLTVDGDMKTKVKGKVVTNTGGSWHHKVDGQAVVSAASTYIKGSPVHWNSGSTPEIDTLDDFDIPDLPDDTTSVEQQQKVIEAVGSTIAPTDDNDEQTVPVTGDVVATVPITPTGCPVLENEQEPFKNGDDRYRTRLTSRFQLADCSIRALYPHHIQAQGGLTQAQIVCNLYFLLSNSVDKIADQFPGMRINCGFRKTQNGTSQHEKGEAVDIQWPSIKSGSLAKYMEICEWIKANVPFDQLILEHGNTCWIHISLKRSGGNRGQVLTMKDGVYTPGLSLFGRT
jgi:hypothetical protein